MSSDNSTTDVGHLLQRARSGDRSAMGVLFERFRSSLKNSAKHQVDGQLAGRIDASDVVQQTFLSACRNIQDFAGETSGEFAVWLGRIQDRNIHDAVRRHVSAQKRSVHREHSAEFDASLLDGEDISPSQRAMRVEQIAGLVQAIETLPSDQQEAVRLRHLEGWSLKQMAEHFDRSKDAVASLLKRGLENLRNHVREDS